MDADANATGPESRHRAFPIVCAGASAGGIEALQELLSELVPPLNLAVVALVHRDPHQENLLARVLASRSALPVLDARPGLALEPRHVYVLPAGVALGLRDGVFVESDTPPDLARRHPIDAFLRALAADVGKRAIAVILSGTGADGTLGAGAVKEAGGIVLAQDASARFEGMPRSAAASLHVDRVLDPAAIANELRQLAEHPYLAGPLEERRPAPEDERAQLRRILSILANATGIDFTLYKQATLGRRVRRRMTVHGLDDLAAYAELLARDPAELQELFLDALIPVTRFFREPAIFEALQQTVFPELLRNRDPRRELRLWVPGCSSGEEVYSLVIVLLELLGDERLAQQIKVFGTDVSEQALERARAGLYPESVAADVGAERARRFFVAEPGGLRVSKRLRDLCVFARHDLTRDPPFSSIDLISCQNVLIYFGSELQRRVFPIFHYALRPEGYLVLGAAEAVTAHEELFERVDVSGQRLYRKNPHARRPQQVLARSFSSPQVRLEPRTEVGTSDGSLLRSRAARMLLERYAPPAVLVGPDLQLLHVFGAAGAYLELPPGEARLGLLELARDGLAGRLRELVATARGSSAPARAAGVRVQTGAGHHEQVDMEVIPVRRMGDEAQALLVVFESARPADARPRAPGWPEAVRQLLHRLGSGPREASEAELELEHAREELEEARRSLHASLEEKEVGIEALKAANEEALSSNEELLSTNEELETAKEELQATNEELSTLNDELRERNLELGRVNDDLDNLLASVDLAIVMLGQDLRIRRFTPAAARAFNLISSDVGRSLRDLRPRVQVGDLEADVTAVLATRAARARDVQDEDGRWFRLTILPYRSAREVHSAVLTLVDIHEVKQIAIQGLRRLAAVVRDSNDALVLVDRAGRIVDWNAAAERLYGYSKEEALQRTLVDLAPPELREEMAEFLRGQLERRGTRSFESQRVARDGRRIEVSITATVLVDENGAPEAVAITERDVTERRQAEVALQQTARHKDEFLAALGHELRNPLAAVLYGLRALSERAGTALTPDDRALLGGAQHQAEAMRRLVNDMLDMARVRQGEIALASRPLDLGEVVRHALAAVEPEAKADGRLLLATLSPAPLWVDGDPQRLEQVVFNLLNNALKFSARGQRVWVEVAAEGDEALLSVRDEGLGIEPEQLAGLFEGAAPAEGREAARRRGLGVGLRVAKQIVELHGGRLEAYSEGLGRGAELRAVLPRRPAPAQVDRESLTPGAARRVLIVEDAGVVAAALAILLEGAGHTVQVAADGEEGLTSFREFDPDVVLADIGLPGEVDGWELARRIRAKTDGHGPLLVALSGYGSEEDRARSREAGFDVHLLKPVDVEELVALIAGAPAPHAR